jgi:8-oxo-dGTP pyrophosphatase MutT (NUDIX family)
MIEGSRMMTNQKPIRNSVKAIIRKDDAMLLIRKRDETGDYYIFPGGGQDKGEDMISTLKRECREEIDSEVIVNDLVLMRKYIGKNHEFAETDTDIHQVEFYFSCQLADGEIPQNGHNIDDGQISVDWVSTKDFERLWIYP